MPSLSLSTQNPEYGGASGTGEGGLTPRQGDDAQGGEGSDPDPTRGIMENLQTGCLEGAMVALPARDTSGETGGSRGATSKRGKLLSLLWETLGS